MVSIIKNQLLKHLSRFTKNLSADKINLSTFKGEGDLSNLELDENVLTDLLELPSWLKLEKAWCNRVLFRIPWTKLKSVPIYLNLDEVNIIVKTCEELRTPASPSTAPISGTVPGKYSFIHKVIDGITINVNTVYIIFNSPAFTASVQISRIMVESKSPSWQRGDLCVTRLKSTERGQVLVFKELEWQTARIEAKSTVDRQLTPLRLLTNHARCRLTIKKRLSDCFVLGSKLVLILDDLLWVLTDSQLKAALHFLKSLAGLVHRATLITRQEKAARKLEVLPEFQAQVFQEARANNAPTSGRAAGHADTAASNLFRRLDVIETSYHFLSQHIVLHLCDDPGDGRSCHPDLRDGGALQISVYGFQVDYYPYHLAAGDRRHWPKYREASVPHTQWLAQSLAHFRSRLLDALDGSRPPPHTPLARTSNNHGTTSVQDSPSSGSPSKTKAANKEILKQLAKLMTTCIIVRIEDFALYKVTTSGKKQALKEFISGDRDHISLPEDTNIVHAEFTYFYYPGDVAFPLPPPKFYVQLNPVQVFFDVDSCLWFNSFALHLHQSLQEQEQAARDGGDGAAQRDLTYVDVKIEAILLRVVVESAVGGEGQRDRPRSLHVQVTRATITNVRSLEQSSRADLARCIDQLYGGSLFFCTDFPTRASDPPAYALTQKLLDHVQRGDELRPGDQRRLLWTDARDVWSASLEPAWADFYGARSVGAGSRPVPFVDAVPLTVWLHSDDGGDRLHALLHVAHLVSAQLNHYQYLFLLRCSEELSELATYVALDRARILGREQVRASSLVAAALLPRLELTFVMPSQCPGKESSGGDLESVLLPDSSSIAEDALLLAAAAAVGGGSAATLWSAPGALSAKQCNGQPPIAVVATTAAASAATPVYQPAAAAPVQNNTATPLGTVKKGLNNLFSSIDSALKGGGEDASDTMSWRSDASSDSEQYVVVAAVGAAATAQDSMFCVTGSAAGAANDPATGSGPATRERVELASEVLEEPDTSPSEHSLASTYKRRDLVSLATFRLTQVEVLHYAAGFNTTLKVQVQDVNSDECGCIPWDEFQSKFASRSRAWADARRHRESLVGGGEEEEGAAAAATATTSRVRMRLDHVVRGEEGVIENVNTSDRKAVLALFRDWAEVRAAGLRLELTMSSATGLADLVEDEILPTEHLPIDLELDDVSMTLVEDRPPANITSPGALPLRFQLDRLDVRRGVDGRIQVAPRAQPRQQSRARQPVGDATTIAVNDEEVRRLRRESSTLRARLAVLERAAEEARVLRRAREEAESLRTSLSAAQDDIARLLQDKSKLLDELRSARDRAPLISHAAQTQPNKR